MLISNLAARRMTSEPRSAISGPAAKVDQRPSVKALHSFYGFGEQPRSPQAKREARSSPLSISAPAAAHHASHAPHKVNGEAQNPSVVGSPAAASQPANPPPSAPGSLVPISAGGSVARWRGEAAQWWGTWGGCEEQGWGRARHRNDSKESVTAMQAAAGGGESGGGPAGPYGHHVPMDLHVPQHFPYYAG